MMVFLFLYFYDIIKQQFNMDCLNFVSQSMAKNSEQTYWTRRSGYRLFGHSPKGLWRRNPLLGGGFCVPPQVTDLENNQRSKNFNKILDYKIMPRRESEPKTNEEMKKEITDELVEKGLILSEGHFPFKTDSHGQELQELKDGWTWWKRVYGTQEKVDGWAEGAEASLRNAGIITGSIESTDRVVTQLSEKEFLVVLGDRLTSPYDNAYRASERITEEIYENKERGEDK
jgi:hypothetical protein